MRSAGGGQAIEGAIVAAQGMAAQQQINFTRDNEYEADRVGIGYLDGAGFDPQRAWRASSRPWAAATGLAES